MFFTSQVVSRISSINSIESILHFFWSKQIIQLSETYEPSLPEHKKKP